MTDHSRGIRSTPLEERGTRRLRRGEWGSWQLDTEALVLWTEAPDYRYEVDLESCINSAEVLDWIAQIAGKRWGDDMTLAGFVRALDDLLVPQENLCTGGASHELTPEQIRELVGEAIGQTK